jgi:exodeoxyribonuclease VII large subunit
LNISRKGRALAALRLSDKPLAQRIEARRGTLASLDGRLARGLPRMMELRAERLARLSARLSPDALHRRQRDGLETLMRAERRMAVAWTTGAERRERRLAQAWRLVDGLSYQATLKRGYAVVLDGEQRPLSRAADARDAGRVTLRFADGDVQAQTGDGPAAHKASKPQAGAKGGQGSLF